MASKTTRLFTPAWRWLIGLGSVGAFLGGWAVVAHAPNPYTTASASAPIVEPAVIDNGSTSSSSDTQVIVPTAVPVPLMTQPSTTTRTTTRIRQPRVRTGGS